MIDCGFDDESYTILNNIIPYFDNFNTHGLKVNDITNARVLDDLNKIIKFDNIIFTDYRPIPMLPLIQSFGSSLIKFTYVWKRDNIKLNENVLLSVASFKNLNFFKIYLNTFATILPKYKLPDSLKTFQITNLAYFNYKINEIPIINKGLTDISIISDCTFLSKSFSNKNFNNKWLNSLTLNLLNCVIYWIILDYLDEIKCQIESIHILRLECTVNGLLYDMCKFFKSKKCYCKSLNITFQPNNDNIMSNILLKQVLDLLLNESVHLSNFRFRILSKNDAKCLSKTPEYDKISLNICNQICKLVTEFGLIKRLELISPVPIMTHLHTNFLKFLYTDSIGFCDITTYSNATKYEIGLF